MLRSTRKPLVRVAGLVQDTTAPGADAAAATLSGSKVGLRVLSDTTCDGSERPAVLVARTLYVYIVSAVRPVSAKPFTVPLTVARSVKLAPPSVERWTMK